MINLLCSNKLYTSQYLSSGRHYRETKFMSSDYTSFGRGKDICSDFASSFKKLNITEARFIQTCLGTQKLGYGSEGSVYPIPIKGLENYVIKIANNFDGKNITKLSKLINSFPHRNFGQAIAKMGDDVLILRRLNGEALDKCFIKDIHSCYKMLADAPQKTFDKYAQKIKIANKYGYLFDGGNPGNILISPKNSLEILDLSKNPVGNMLGDLLMPFLKNFNVSTSEIIENRIILVEKLFKAAKKYQFKYGIMDEAFECFYHMQNTKVREKLDIELDKYLE